MTSLPPSTPLGRFMEMDLLRGVAVGLMILYHGFFDLVFFAGWELNLNNGPIWMIGRSAAVLFVGLAGASMGLAWKRKHDGEKKPLIVRGLQIIGTGMVLTLFTWIFFPGYTIWFGVLHLIGTAMIAGTLLLAHPRTTFLAGIGITIAGILFSISNGANQIPILIPIFPVTFQTFDYFPLFPWLGVFFLGMSAGEYFFPSGRQRHLISVDMRNPISKGLVWAGRHSLGAYFIHQPILVGLIWGAATYL